MGSTYLQLTNKVLKRLNEVQLDSSTFADVLGIHAAAKDAVIDALQKINAQKFEWPFNATTGSQLLVVGQEEYTWPADYKIADWDSFYIEKDDALSVSTTRLKRVNKEEWYRHRRTIDFDSESDGLDLPRFVFRTNSGWGLTPSPNEAYTVNFNYFKIPTELSLHDDECTVPSAYDYVIVSAAMWYMYLWRENEERAQLARSEYDDNIKHMTNVLITEYSDMVDTRVNFGGGHSSSTGFYWGEL